MRVEAPGRKIHQPQEDQEDHSISETSSDEPLDTSSGRDLQCGYVEFVSRPEKVYRALGTLRRPDNDNDADFGRESSPEG